MTDIVERLKHPAECPDCGRTFLDDVSAEAADEIERLREENHRLNARLGVYRGYLGEMGRPTKGIDG